VWGVHPGQAGDDLSVGQLFLGSIGSQFSHV
jgi:hypothetical protein